VEQLPRDAEEITGLGVREIVEHHEALIHALDEPPVLIGHSYGGTAAYERYCVPETGQIFYEAGFANNHLHPPTALDFKNGDRAPLLIVGAGEDHTVPASLAKAQYK
jgi:surfactin synthase thioesterase subunit